MTRGAHGKHRAGSQEHLSLMASLSGRLSCSSLWSGRADSLRTAGASERPTGRDTQREQEVEAGAEK